MSKEAKIGLLLGLVFIVAIAIVLRGVRNNNKGDAANQLAINGHVASPTGTGETGGLAMPEAVRQLDENYQEPEPVENSNNNDLENNGAEQMPDPGREETPAPSNVLPPWATTIQPPRYEQYLPGTESAPNPVQNPDRPIVSLGSLNSGIDEWSYVVREDDSLWKIAQRELGDPSRHTEISLLNNLSSPDDLKIGQTLRMPSRHSAAPRSTSNLPLSNTGGSEDYLVRDGDSLWRIAQRELGDPGRVQEIMQLNNLTNDKIKEGQRLRLPARRNVSNSTNIVDTGGGRTYIVREGDNLWRIAQRELGDPQRFIEIKSLNNLGSDELSLGQRLRLPERYD